MLCWMNGASRACSFGVTTNRCSIVLYPSPPMLTRRYRTTATGIGQLRRVNACDSASTAPRIETPVSMSAVGIRP